MRLPILLLLLILPLQFAREGPAHALPGEVQGPVELAEDPGAKVPLDVPLRDEGGTPLTLGEAVAGRPFLLTLVYFRCDHDCPLLLEGLAEALGELPMEPGRDFAAVTLSFDETDGPGTAVLSKGNLLPAAGRPIPEGAWRFLTGDREAIRRITGKAGFSFARVEHGFAHPETLIVLAPDGTISRYMPARTYLSGSYRKFSFSPTELSFALGEARRGVVARGPSATAQICFPHEPTRQGSFFTFLAVFGGINLAAVLGLFAFLALGPTRAKGKGAGGG